MSPFIDDRGRLFGRVNILDIFVLLLIVVLAVFAFTRTRDATVTTFKVRTTLKAEKLREPPVDKIKVGQTVRDDIGNVLGKVERPPTTIPTKEEVPTAEGGLAYPDSQVYYDLSIDVVGTAQGSKSSPRVGSTPVNKGATIQVVGPGWTFKAVIQDWAVVNP